MPQRRLLYVTSRQVSVFQWAGGRLEADAVFSNDEEGIAEFSRLVAGAPHALYYLLADVVEEDFHTETIPFVRGGDRRTLLGRKLAQRYRDTSLALTMSLGFETGGRREEQILFSSFTNTQQFQPWLATLRAQEARLVGMYSVPLLAPIVGKRIGFGTAKRYLLVSHLQAGLRQSYVEDGKIRFSRLGRMENADPAAVARSCAVESARIQQFLTNSRVLTRDSGPLEVIVLAPSAEIDAYRHACVSNSALDFHVLDLDATCAGAGLKESPGGVLAERLYLHALALSQPGEQFADNGYRRFYHLWRAKVALFSAGAAVFAFCALFAGVKMLDLANVNQLADTDREQQRRLDDQYARVQAQFPKTPTSPENLKALVRNFDLLERQTTTPDKVFLEISGALAPVPQIELEKIDWQIGQPPAARLPGAPGAPPPAPPPAPAPGAAAQAATDGRLQGIEIAGRINVPQASDYRGISAIVNQFVEGLRKRPGITVVSTRLPFDITAEQSLSGDIGVERATDVPRFTIVFTKALGA